MLENKVENLETRIYKDIAVGEVPRIFSLCDRDPNSDTRGCVDRNYWHYKQIDFPNARLQEAMLLFAILYTENFDGNIYYGKEKVREWACSALDYWTNIQNQDGSFSEIYPNERSFCCTSFSTYSASESMLLLDDRMGIDALIRSGKWLESHTNPDVSNQVAGSVIALYNVYLLTDDEFFKRAAEEKALFLIKLQDSSGFFPEYGGFDIGYQSITLSMLAKYFKKSNADYLPDVLQKGTEFLKKEINEIGDFDISNTSRKTQFFYPHSLAILKEVDLMEANLTGVEKGVVVNPAWMDDRYCSAYAIDYLQTYLETKGTPNENDNF